LDFSLNFARIILSGSIHLLMNFRSVFRSFIIGNTGYIPSRGDYKTTMLRGQLSLVMIGAAIVYLVTDHINGIEGYAQFYWGGIVVSAIVFWLNRSGYYITANVVFLLVFNLIIFVFAANDRHRAGTFMHFLIAPMVAMAFFGYRKRWWALPFCALSFMLFWSAYVWKVQIIPIREENISQVYGDSYVQLTLIVNFSLCFVIAILLLLFLSNVNHASERALLKANELLTKTNRELDRFVYSASHDLKAPLSSVLGLIEIADRTQDPEELKACLQMMRTRVHNLDGFIKDITDYSRNTRLEVKKEKINVLSLVQDSVDGLRYAEGFETIYFKYNIPPNLEIVSDKARLKVVLNNLIANALKYHDRAKDQPLIEVAAQIQENSFRVEVNDNGIGIDPVHIGNIFDMFYRASEKSTGSGLGLYIVKESLEKLMGTIAVDSTTGVGSRFTVTLPIG
jgi:signal transduction histidine kinase